MLSARAGGHAEMKAAGIVIEPVMPYRINLPRACRNVFTSCTSHGAAAGMHLSIMQMLRRPLLQASDRPLSAPSLWSLRI